MSVVYPIVVILNIYYIISKMSDDFKVDPGNNYYKQSHKPASLFHPGLTGNEINKTEQYTCDSKQLGPVGQT